MNIDHEWNAGQLGCGELVPELRMKLRASPGSVFRVIALDPGAPADIPAWCAMTGHELLTSDPAAHTYVIRAKS